MALRASRSRAARPLALHAAACNGIAEPEWAGILPPEDLRGLTPLFWAHVLPYGEVKLNMTRRIALNAAQTVETNAESS